MIKETKKMPPKEDAKLDSNLRRIIIETDGDMVRIVKAEVNGNIELIGILSTIIGHITNKKK